MSRLPREAIEAVARGLAAYIRDQEVTELPGPLRRFKGFTDRGIRSQSATLVESLSDAGLRARVVEWLGDKPRRLAPADAEVLRIAAERSDGWEKTLTARFARDATVAKAQPSRSAIEREQEKARRAKLEARKAKERSAARTEADRARITALQGEIKELKARVAAAERAETAALKQVEAMTARLERDARKHQRDLESLRAERQELSQSLRAARREAAASSREVDRLKAKQARRPAKAKDTDTPRLPERRRVLSAPLGRTNDDPATLEAWLAEEGVVLVVDGYNVTKAEAGFGDLPLEQQRQRLIQELSRLARRFKVATTIVFDGSDVAPATARVPRGQVTVEYSKAGVIADDHIVALLESLPAYPVIVATNDRELQHRVKRLGATVASSDQLLAALGGR